MRILGIIFGILVFILHAQEINIESQNGVYATFEIKAQQSALLALSANGVVESINVDVGSVVKKGDKLLSLKAKDLRENVQVAKASLEALRAKHSFITAQFKRYEKSKDALDANSFEKVQAEYKASVFELQRAEANYALQKELLDNTILYAPFDGVITQKLVEVGDGVGAISSKAFALESLEKKALIYFDSKYFESVKIGDSFQYKIDNVMQERPLKITKIYPSIDKNTKKAMAESVVENAIPSGIFGDGFIILSPTKIQ